jgi:hypothetical protein
MLTTRCHRSAAASYPQYGRRILFKVWTLMTCKESEA